MSKLFLCFVFIVSFNSYSDECDFLKDELSQLVSDYNNATDKASASIIFEEYKKNR